MHARQQERIDTVLENKNGLNRIIVSILSLLVFISAAAVSYAADEMGNSDDGAVSAVMTAGDLEDGTYDVEAESSSKYFRIEKAEMTVSGDSMNVRFTLSSISYKYVFQGTKEEAEQAEEDAWIPAEEPQEVV